MSFTNGIAFQLQFDCIPIALGLHIDSIPTLCKWLTSFIYPLYILYLISTIFFSTQNSLAPDSRGLQSGYNSITTRLKLAKPPIWAVIFRLKNIIYTF